MSALGQKQTFAPQKSDVRFTPQSRHVRRTTRCLLSARSRHSGRLFDHLVGGDQQAGRNGDNND